MFTGILAYANDIALLAPTASAMRRMLLICESYAADFACHLMLPSLNVLFVHLGVHRLKRNTCGVHSSLLMAMLLNLCRAGLI